MKTRGFRTPESYEAENNTRRLLPDFLRSRGFDVVRDRAERNGQTIVARTPEGDQVTMRVRLCWSRDTRRRNADRMRTYSGVQLLARVKNGDWERTVRRKVERERFHGVTHLLIVQGEDESIVYAALVPLSEVLPIWCDQRDISARLMKQGNPPRKNHAMNGSSPTLWLQDDRAPQVAEALWNHEGVQDLVKMKPATSVGLAAEEADRTESEDDAPYAPQGGDWRERVKREICKRRGRKQFRDALRKRYRDRCVVTGCQILAVLEAAHINPYRGENDNHPENGLLLRADIHTLFDLDLLGIEPKSLKVRLHPDLAKEYRHLAGKALDCPPDQRPSPEALRVRYEQFQRRAHRPA